MWQANKKPGKAHASGADAWEWNNVKLRQQLSTMKSKKSKYYLYFFEFCLHGL